MKTCSRCKLKRSIDDFNISRTSRAKDGLNNRCKPCNREYWMYLKAKHPEWAENRKKRKYDSRKYDLKKFGLTIELYEEMLKKQKGTCAICKLPPIKKRLAVDHDHATGKVRGLLCGKCNKGLGLFCDNHKLLSKAKQYLMRSVRHPV